VENLKLSATQVQGPAGINRMWSVR